MGGSESNSMTYFYQVLTFISPARSFQKRFQNPVEHEAVIEMYGNQQSTELPLLYVNQTSGVPLNPVFITCSYLVEEDF